jgi:hypothetical protein
MKIMCCLFRSNLLLTAITFCGRVPTIDQNAANRRVLVYYSPPRGFLRAPNGAFTTFDYPGTNQGTFPSGITPAGTITGSYYANGQYHGFLRTRKGTFTTFDYPGTPGSTYPFAINPTGEIAGYYTDASGNQQCFLRIPAHPDE